MRRRAPSSVIILLAVVACGKRTSDSTPEQGNLSVQNPQTQHTEGASGGSQTTVANDVDLDLPEDFADDATAEVTEANVEAQLSAIEKELRNAKK